MKTDPQTNHPSLILGHKFISSYLEKSMQCAMQLLENGSYILKELPSLRMPDALREQIETLCGELISMKHDLVHEVYEVEELIAFIKANSVIVSHLKMMDGWLDEITVSYKECVDCVRAAVTNGEADPLLKLLLEESGCNILLSMPGPPETEDWVEEQLVVHKRSPKQEDGLEASEPSKASALSPEEKDELLAACRQVEAERRIEKETEEYEPESYDEDDDETDEDEDSYDPNCYAFCSEDSYPIGKLVSAIRCLTDRSDLPAETAEKLKVFLFVMERLPLVTPGIRMSLGLRLDQGGESDWIEIRMEDGEFTLGRGAWVDGDADTETVFEVTPDYREGDAFAATHFAESFAECAHDVCRKVVIEDFSDEPFTAWDMPQEKERWNDLPCSFE
jgi:hypothetical protein